MSNHNRKASYRAVKHPSDMMYLHLLLMSFAWSSIALPEYTRGPTPNWMVPTRNRENSITYLGAHERLRVVMDKARKVAS